MKRTITVPGQGKVTVEPDIASVRLGVNVIAETAGAAREGAALTMNKVLAALDKAAIARRDVRTSMLSLSPTLDYSNDKGPRVTGYHALNSLSVTVRDLAAVGKVIDAALAAGASTLDSLEFTLEDGRVAAAEARSAAVADAHARASTIAAAAGARVGKLIAVTEGSAMDTPVPFPAARMALKAQDASTPVESGTQEISVALSATFEITGK